MKDLIKYFVNHIRNYPMSASRPETFNQFFRPKEGENFGPSTLLNISLHNSMSESSSSGLSDLVVLKFRNCQIVYESVQMKLLVHSFPV